MKDDTVSRASVLKAIDEYERLSMVSQTVRNMTSLREIVQWLPAVQTCEDAVKSHSEKQRNGGINSMTSKEICKLLEIIIGETEPVADSAIDPVRAENLKTLIDIGNWVLDGLLYAAEHRKDPYYSSQTIGETAYAAMLEWKEWLEQKEEELA